MPIIPPLNAPYYDSVEAILQFARVIANDAQLTIAGDLLSDNQPYTLTMMNLAWRKLQDRLGNNAIEEFPQEFILQNVLPMDSSVSGDPGAQVWIGANGYFDGVTLQPLPALPPDMYIPLRLWERQTGTNQQFVPMFPTIDGLPSLTKTGLFRIWEWRDDAIWLEGALQAIDIRLRYRRTLPDTTTVDDQIPLIRAAVALAYLIVEVFVTARGGTVLPAIVAQKEDAIKQLINVTTRKRQRTNYRRLPYSRRGNRLNF
jgi:hypothetical protein